MFKAMESEEAVCEARTTNRARGERVQARTHSAAATRFYPARASSAGSGDRAQGRACYLGNFIARLRNLSLKILVMMTQKTRETKNKLQLTDQQQKRESGEFKDKGGTISGFFQS
jgi:hypothetical protein